MSEAMHRSGVYASIRHRTSYLEAGPTDGPLMVFMHGWPEMGLMWRHQLTHFAAAGWRCVAPDMRGYGGSSVPTDIAAYALEEVVGDMVELHDTLGGKPAIWVGHDWGSPVAWALASHHPERCRGVVSLCVPYLSRGFALPNLLPWIDRAIYPAGQYPVGQWDYWLFHRDRFAKAARQFEADIPATIAALYRSGSQDGAGRPAVTANVRERGGWFGPGGQAAKLALDEALLSRSDHAALVHAFTETGFRGADAWYLNDAPNIAYAARARNFGQIDVPVLFLHAAWDAVCETVQSHLAEPMRADCSDLTESVIEAGHEMQIERREEVNAVIADWLSKRFGRRPGRTQHLETHQPAIDHQ